MVGLALTLLLLGPLVMYVRIKHGPPQPVSYYGGLAFGILMFPLLGGWIAWRVSGRRSYLPATVTFCVIAVLASLGQVGAVRQHQQELAAVEGIYEDLDDFRDSIETADPSVSDSERVNRLAQSMEERAGQFKSAQVAADLMREMAINSQPYDEAMDRLSKAGGIDVPSMKSPDDIAQRLELVRQFGAANDAFDTYLSGLENEARTRLQSAGATKAETDGFMSGFMRSFGQNIGLVREVRRIDRDLIRAMQDLLILLKSTWGAWRTDAGSGELLFDNDAEVVRCSQLFEQIEKLRLEQRKTQMQIDAQQQRRRTELKQQTGGAR